MEHFDVAIVGAGPGSKAMFGGVLYTTILQRLFLDFYQEEQCVEGGHRKAVYSAGESR